MRFIFGLLVLSTTVALSGCVSDSLHKNPPKQARIGVMSLMPKPNFEASHATAKLQYKNLERYSAYSHSINDLNLNKTITRSIANMLKSKGYTHVSEIAVGPQKSPVKTVLAHPELNLVIVVSPDEGQAPAYTSAEQNSDLLYGYGLYSQDVKSDHHTFGYANYDISIYNTKSLAILASHHYSQSTELKYSPWSKSYAQQNPITIVQLKHWLKTHVAQDIQKQTIKTLG